MKTILALAFCSLTAAAGALDYVWTGAADTDFANPANWLVNGSVPATAPANDDSTAGDTVVLPESATANMPVLMASWNVKELRFLGSNWTFTAGTNTVKIGRYGNGLVSTNLEGTNTFSGNLRLGSVDTPGPGWDIAPGGVLRVDGTIGRYAQTSGGGAIRKRGGGVLELNTGTSTLNGLNVEGGTVRIIAGLGALDANKSLAVNAGVYDLNGNSVNVMSLGGSAIGCVTNSSNVFATLSTSFGGSATIPLFLSGALHVSWGHNGTPRTLTFIHGTNTYTGRTTVNSGITAILRASSPLDDVGVFGLSPETVTVGTPGSGGGGTMGRVGAILTDGPFTVGKHITIGTDKGRHVLGTLPSQTVSSVFSGNIMVGLGALYNGDNPHLEIQIGTNAWVDFTGNITNALGATGNYALRDGKLFMLGSGVARLTGNNSYKGGTVVSNGTLLASSVNALGLGDAVVAGGTLGGTFTVTGAVSVLNGAALTAGETNTIGTVTLKGGLTLDANSSLKFQIAEGTSDLIRVSGGAISVTSPVRVDLETLAPATVSQYTLLDWSGSAAGIPQITDFVLVDGSDDYALSVRNSTLVARTLSPQGTLISVY